MSKKEQKKRFQAIEDDPLESWRVSDTDWARLKKYSEYLAAGEEMLELTETEFAPWTIVEATSKWYARKKVFDTIIAALEKRLGTHAPPAPKADKSKSKDASLREAMESLGGSQ
jgi:polyphosphate kinase 2 (PPK2 family)